VLLASRSLEELEAVCDRVILLHRGRIVGERTPGVDEDLAEPYAMVAARRRLER
jgi:ABC-type Na+ transport system ATPase subunit NatA